MNAGVPAEQLGITEARRDLIEQLENWGYDLLAGVPANWRSSMSDDAMRDAVSGIGGDPHPELGELVEAIREHVAAGEAYVAAHPDEAPTRDGPEGERWLASFARLKALSATIDEAQRKVFGA